MPSIVHCGKHRRAQAFWLMSSDICYKYEKLLSTTCPKCDQFVLEVIGVTANNKKAPARRIKTKDHEKWINRTSISSGDLAFDMDTSQWESLRNAAHRVKGSMPVWPFIFRETQVK
jgi:hypothetical protein